MWVRVCASLRDSVFRIVVNENYPNQRDLIVTIGHISICVFKILLASVSISARFVFKILVFPLRSVHFILRPLPGIWVRWLSSPTSQCLHTHLALPLFRPFVGVLSHCGSLMMRSCHLQKLCSQVALWISERGLVSTYSSDSPGIYALFTQRLTGLM